MNGYKNKKGYLMLCLYDKPQNGKWYPIHRLIAKTFISNPDNLPQVNHKDEDKNNNCIDNLEWCENEYNHNYGTRNKRAGLSNRCCESTSKKIYSVDDYGNYVTYDSIGEAERQTGCWHSNIIKVLKGQRKNLWWILMVLRRIINKSPSTTERKGRSAITAYATV